MTFMPITVEQVATWAVGGSVTIASGLVVTSMRRLGDKIERFTEAITKLEGRSSQHDQDIKRLDGTVGGLPCMKPKCPSTET
jgi:hypothetical protein